MAPPLGGGPFRPCCTRSVAKYTPKFKEN